MEWKRRTTWCSTVPAKPISAKLRRIIAGSWLLTLVFVAIALLPKDLYGQANVVCSGEDTSFSEYLPIEYPYFPRRTGIGARFECDLTILPGGKFTHRMANPITDKELARTSVYAVQIESWSGKENWMEQADQLPDWPPLPDELLNG